MGEGHADEPSHGERLTVAQAADELGITEGAVRSRIKRGTLRTERVGGRVYVLLGGEYAGGEPTDEPANAPDHRDQLIEVLREQLSEEREARRRADHIIAALTERIPELESPPQSPQEAREQPPEPSEGSEPVGSPPEPHSGAEGAQRPWWRRLLGR